MSTYRRIYNIRAHIICLNTCVTINGSGNTCGRAGTNKFRCWNAKLIYWIEATREHLQPLGREKENPPVLSTVIRVYVALHIHYGPSASWGSVPGPGGELLLK
jgi:hypothetical protein